MAPTNTPLPLSFIQKRIWFIEKLEVGSAQYLEQQVFRLKGELRVDRFLEALNLIVKKHESLRTCFDEKEGEAFQTILPDYKLKIELNDLTELSRDERQKTIDSVIDEDSRTPFDFSSGPPVRGRLVKAQPKEHLFIWNCHHLVTDGWSRNIFNRELSNIYEDLLSSRPVSLANPQLSYSQHVEAQHQYLDAPEARNDLTYWENKLKDPPAPVTLPFDHPKEVSGSKSAGAVSRELPESITNELLEQARETGTSQFMILLAAFNVLLSRLSGKEDLIVGSPVTGRSQDWEEEIIGAFIETLPIRTKLSGNPRFNEYLQQTKETILEAFDHQRTPFEQLVEHLNPNRRASESPLFSILFNMHSRSDTDSLNLKGLEVEEFDIFPQDAKYDLTLYILQSESTLTVTASYRRALFNERSIEYILDQYINLISQISLNTGLMVQEYSLVSPRSKRLLPDPEIPLTKEKTVPVLHQFDKIAEEYGKNPAIREEGVSWSYNDLLVTSKSIAHELSALGIVEGDVVAITGKRCFELIAAILAVMRMRAVFFLLDPSLPNERCKTQLSISGARCIVSTFVQKGLTAENKEILSTLPTLYLSSDWVNIHNKKENSSAKDFIYPSPSDPCYLFFTSGSTGVPKGVLGNNCGLSHFIDWERKFLSVEHRDRIAQLTNLSFDVILRDIFLPLTAGAVLCIHDRNFSTKSVNEVDWLNNEQITILHTVPSLANSWMNSDCPAEKINSLRYVLFAGEPLSSALVEKWRLKIATNSQVINLYGPTETTLAKAYHQVSNPSRKGIQPIGRALPGAQLLVLNESSRQCGIREPGEIVIRTPYRTNGYLNDPSRNTSRFFQNPFNSDGDDICYRSGDKGAYDSDGNLLIFGRLDDQVKIRGIRIEPADIAANLESHPSIQQSVVIAKDDPDDNKRLIAYYSQVLGSQSQSPWDLREYLRERLPEYMVPEIYISLKQLPLNNSGKVDRRNLPEPDFTQSLGTTEFIPPSSEIERKLASIWEDLLGIHHLGINDNFFDIGGHSLLATRLIARINKQFKKEISLWSFSRSPTINGLRRLIESEESIQPTTEQLAEPGKDSSRLPLSRQQEGFWFVNQLEGVSPEHNIFRSVRIKGDLNIAKIQKALEMVVSRHAVLQSRFVEHLGKPFMLVDPDISIKLEQLSLKSISPDRIDDILSEKLAEMQMHLFELKTGPLFRIKLIKLKETEFILSWVSHYIIIDDESADILVQELGYYYTSSLERVVDTASESVQYSDYAEWQSEHIPEVEISRQAEFWKTRLKDLSSIEISSNYAAFKKVSYQASSMRFAVSKRIFSQVNECSTLLGTTPEIVFHAAFHVLLSRYSGQGDIVTGQTVSIRPSHEFKDTLGLFINTLVRRTDLTDRPTFRETINRVEKWWDEARDNQDVPFHNLVAAVNPPRISNRHPVFQVLANIEGTKRVLPEMNGLSVEPLKAHVPISRFDLELHMNQAVDSWEGMLVYREDTFEKSFIQGMARHFMVLTDHLLQNIDHPVDDIKLLEPSEEKKILLEWNRLPVPLPAANSVHALFEEQAEQRPDSIALEDGHNKLSYKELQISSNQLSTQLRDAGIGRGDPVGVFMDRSINFVVSILAVLKSGAVYVPLAKEYPAKRILHMVADSNLELILADQPLPDELNELQNLVLMPEAGSSGTTDFYREHLVDCSHDDPAYIMYTSGSTGQPKGSVIPHRGIIRLVKGQNYTDFNTEERFLFLSSPSFDASTFELWGALLNGATCVIHSPRYPDLKELGDTIRNHQITTVWLTAGLFNLIVDTSPEILKGLNNILTGGEALSPEHVRKAIHLFPHLRLTNGYGPTECTTFACTHHIQNEDVNKPSIPIGRPIQNTTAYILDSYGNPVPPGVKGELHIGGPGLSLGYLNQPTLTKEKFIPNPFSSDSSSTLYKTGDICSYRNDGCIEFHGRYDNQVKVRGFRIELEEIERTISSYPDIARSVVVPLKEDSSPISIIAYYVAKEASRSVSREELMEYLRQQLPDYEMPAHYFEVKDIPLNANGKVDHSALPSPSQNRRDYSGRVPRTSLEKQLVEIWQQLFSTETIYCDESFFELGGHSLLATRMIAEIVKETGFKIPISAVFEAPTISSLARILEKQTASAGFESLVPLQKEGNLDPLFCLPGMNGDIYGFVGFAGGFAPFRPVYGLQAIGADGSCPMHPDVESMAAHYVNEIMNFRPSGPYNLIGYSAGGWIAFAVAQKLRQQGQEVRLHMVDTSFRPSLMPYPVFILNQVVKIIDWAPHHFSMMRGLTLKEKHKYVRLRLRNSIQLFWRSAPATKDKRVDPLKQKDVVELDHFTKAIVQYRPVHYRGNVDYISATGRDRRKINLLPWKLLMKGEFNVHYVEGGHEGLVNPQFVGPIATLVNRLLIEKESS